MALQATGVVIWDPLSGSNNNAGYFDASLANAGTDYSAAQATPILALTDLACASGSTTLTSATGGFTSAMIGNGIYIVSGTNMVAGLYVITARTDTNTVTLDRTPTSGGDGSSGVGNVGGRRAVFTDAFLEAMVAGMTQRVWATATMTLTETLLVTVDGTAAAPMTFEGRSSTGAADPSGDNRPLISAGAYDLFGNGCDYMQIRHLRVTATNAYGLRAGSWPEYESCAAANTTSAGGRNGLTLGQYGVMVGCDVQCTKGYGVVISTGSARCELCYVHDSGASNYSAFDLPTRNDIVSCIIDTCYRGILIEGNSNRIVGCTIYNCTNAQTDGGTARTGLYITNTILHTCTYGLYVTTEYAHNWVDWCNFYNCTTDRTNIAAGANDIDADPQFDDAPNGNFARTAVAAADGRGMTLAVS